MRGGRESKPASAGTMFRLLMWKNFLQQWRHRKQTVAEVVVPVLTMALVLILRSQIDPYTMDEIRYPPLQAHSLNSSLNVLAGMNLTRMSLAYSPESPILEDIVRTSLSNMLINNALDLIPLITEQLPSEIIDLIPIGIFNMTVIQEVLKSLVRVDPYNSSADLRSIYIDEESTRMVIAAVQFDDSLYGAEEISENMSYSLRFPEKPRMNSFFGQGARSWRTNLLFPTAATPGPRAAFSWEGGQDPGYIIEMFIALQHSLSTEIISRIANTSFHSLDVRVRRYPHPAYTMDLAVQLLQLMFPMFMILSFSYTAVNICRAVTVEKELQLKEAMKIMGLPTWLHWLAWFCKQFIFLMIMGALIVMLLKVSWFTTEEGLSDYAVFTNTPWTVLLFFTLLYLACTICFCFMISGFFAKANTAALFTGVIWFISYIPAMLLAIDEDLSMFVQVLTCFSINSAMSYGYQLMLAEESTGGLQWGEFFYSPSSDRSRLLFGHVVLMLLADCVLYMCVALYLEQVNPGAFGARRPWYFLLQREFWLEDTKKDDSEAAVTDDFSIIKESDPTELGIGVKISNLSKTFGDNIAVDQLSLNIYNDQISVLLGHNGAGKSTTLAMLTGNISPSSGSVRLAGYDVARQRRAARAHLGFCPQHDVLFADLTVREHLEFFARLKGLAGEELDEEVESLIEKLELQEKRDYQAAGLSGGQKRRLSVGIALCGGALVVLLDEPTSGMDPASRRALWDLLQQEKHGRSMILTTHFMDEADYLGDRVAIMSHGRLRCVGSPYFLKQRYGVGYTLVVVKGPGFRPELCTTLVSNYIPDSAIKEDRGTEVTYSLPNSFSHVFEAMLLDLEQNIHIIGYTNYGLTATTLEDVFMSVGSDVSLESSDLDETATTSDSGSDEVIKNEIETSSVENLDGKDKTITGAKLIWQQIRAIWFKLFLVWSRSWGLLLLQILVPITIMTLTLGILEYITSLSQAARPRNLTLAEDFTYTETYMGYNESVTAVSTTFGAIDAYRGMFNASTMQLQDLGTQPVDQYYLERGSDSYELGLMRSQALIGATFEEEAVTAWFSNFGYHDVAISLAAVHQALLQSRVPAAQLNVTNYPLEVNYERMDDLQLLLSMLSMQLSQGVGNSLGIISAVFIMFYIKERISRAKLLQKASGVQPIVMWGSAAVFDWVFFILLCVTFIIACAAFQVVGFSSFTELGRMYLCFMVYGAAMLPVVYLFSYCFNGPAVGFVCLFFVNIIIGLTGAQIVDMLTQIPTVDQAVPEIMDLVLQFYPLYSVVTAIRNLNQIRLIEWSCLQSCDMLSAALPSLENCTVQFMCDNYLPECCVREDPYWDWESPGVMRYMISMAATCVLLWLLMMFIEYRLHHKMFTSKAAPPAPVDERSMDEDVVLEAKHVQHVGDAALSRHNLLARRLTKYYGKHLAVNQVSFSVGEMECFGLLGVNGAGKTTTFKMLMGDELVSQGDAFVRGHSVRKDIGKVHANIGYCPQFDAVFNELTGRETLRLFALLRGLRPETTATLTASLADSLGFTKHLDKRVHQYSGGNKRKLSTAVALMGFGRVVFLDEPTTGVDPAAKRQVWRAVRKATHNGKAVVLTSHSMEECEALCSRLTIMVNGQFQCLGTPQHLKNKFSEGFTLTIKLKIEENRRAAQTNEIKQFVGSNFKNPRLMEEYEGLLTYYLPDRSTPWSTMFGVMERAKRELCLEDYSIAQTTLEQIFLQFTKYQKQADVRL